MTIKFVLTLSAYWKPILDKSLEKLFKDATNNPDGNENPKGEVNEKNN